MSNKSNCYSVYRFIFPNGKYYIGMTGTDPKIRWNNGKSYNGLVKRAIDKYGWDNIEKEIVQSNLFKSEAESLEIEMISCYNTTDSHNGYNISSGGSAVLLGYHPSEETRAKLRAYALNRPDSHNRKISDALKGRVPSEERRQHQREVMTGRKHTDEAKAKISYASRHRSEQAKENHRKGLQGHIVTAETRRKISESQRGVPKPEWLRQKFKEAAKRRSAETIEKQVRGRSTPIYCITTNNLYKTYHSASINEKVSEERIGFSSMNGVAVKGLIFKKYPRGTDVYELSHELGATLIE